MLQQNQKIILKNKKTSHRADFFDGKMAGKPY